MNKTRQTLDKALAAQNERNWAVAESLYREVLSKEPQNADALHLLGLVQHQQGLHEEAVHWIERAVRANPQVGLFHNNLGIVLSATGKFDRAVGCFESALRRDRRIPGVRYNLGVVLHKCRRINEAIQQYEAALREGLDLALLNNLGSALEETGRIEEAIAMYNRALQIDANFADSLLNLGRAMRKVGRHDDALAKYEQRLKFEGVPFDLLIEVGGMLLERGRLEEAALAYRKAIALRRDAKLCNNLGALLNRLGDFEEAKSLLEEAIREKPDYAAAYNHLGILHLDLGRPDLAMVHFDRAISLDSSCAEAYYNRSLAMLTLEDFPRAWHEYEWRHRYQGTNSPLPDYRQPLWRGENLEGRTLLIYAEQGLGDSLQFARYIPEIARLGATVYLLCSPKLHRMLKSITGLAGVLSPGDMLPHFDFHVPLMGLPAACNTTRDSIPAEVPYLRVPEDAANVPCDTANESDLKVGLVWAGSSRHPKDRFRSIPFEMLGALAGTQYVRFFSLQAGSKAKDLSHVTWGNQIKDLGSALDDFSDTAAVLTQLDLLISVDTSVAHLAGALGRPVWLLVPFAADWRWGLQGERTPWYPTIRLFRQSKFGDWTSVLKDIQENLVTISRASKSSRLGLILGPSSIAQSSSNQFSVALPGNFRGPEGPRLDTDSLLPSTRTYQQKHDTKTGPLYFSGQPGEGSGWGVCNRYLLMELSKLAQVVPVAANQSLFRDTALPGDHFTPLQGFEFAPFCPARGRRNFGYAFFENELTDRSVENASRLDRLFVGSSWCKERLEERGILNGEVLVQGVDTTIFCPQRVMSGDGRYLLFSGGKLELRKGQDLVLAAFKVLSKRYPEMVLVNAWHNPWPQTIQSLASSQYIRLNLDGKTWSEQIASLCRANGIDPGRVMTLGPLSHEKIARVYQMTDVGIFPNRCEGGTNLVMMEYMACGKPVVASFATGHRDILNSDNALLLKQLKEFNLSHEGRTVARWEEASVDEIIAHVEFAYHNRTRAEELGIQAGQDMASWTWRRAAETVLRTIG